MTGAPCPRPGHRSSFKGLSLGELQKLIDAAPPAAGRPMESGALRPFRRCASRATAPGIIKAQPIRRPAMVRLFSTVLRREPDGRHMLVTPVEKLEIEVDATAFRAIEMTSEGDGARRRIALRARQRRRRDSRSRSSAADGRDRPRPRPRVLVRHGLEAELTRPVYYELAEIALAEGHRAAGHVERRRLLPARGAR